MEDQEWIGISEAARLSGMSVSTMRRWCDSRLVKSRKRKDGRKIMKLSLLSYLATECSISVPRKIHGAPEKEMMPFHDSHEVCNERLHGRDERITELKAEVAELKEQNKYLQSEVKCLQSEVIKNGYELRAILAEQTGSTPTAWVKTTKSSRRAEDG